jgi:hypothetical protein
MRSRPMGFRCVSRSTIVLNDHEYGKASVSAIGNMRLVADLATGLSAKRPLPCVARGNAAQGSRPLCKPCREAGSIDDAISLCL